MSVDKVYLHSVLNGVYMFNLFSFLRKNKGYRPVEFSDTLSYVDNFERALKFTKKLGFNEGSIKDINGRSLDFENMMEYVCFETGLRDFKTSAGQCVKWCHFLNPYFERALGCRIWTTVGQIWKGDKCIYNPSYDEFERWSRKGFQHEDFLDRPALNLHAWYTTETGHLIDITYMSSLAKLYSDCDEFAGGVLVGKPDDIFPGHQYVPMIVGNRIIEKIQEKSFIPFLANDVEELKSIALVIYPDPHYK